MKSKMEKSFNLYKKCQNKKNHKKVPPGFKSDFKI